MIPHTAQSLVAEVSINMTEHLKIIPKLDIIYECYCRHSETDDAAAPVVADDLAWMQVHLSLREDHNDYVRLSRWVSELQVVNDATECAVKNAQEVAELTRYPDHRDNVLLIMSDTVEERLTLGRKT